MSRKKYAVKTIGNTVIISKLKSLNTNPADPDEKFKKVRLGE